MLRKHIHEVTYIGGTCKKRGVFGIITEYDYFLVDHIAQFEEPGRRFTSYLSPETAENLISLVEKSASKNIGREVIASKYFLTIVVLSNTDHIMII